MAVMLVPQAMAYAMLAGLPPQVGLYASILPLILYALWGSSYCLAVGPVAMVALLVSSGVSNLATPGSQEYLELCLLLAGMVGVMQIGMAVFRLGFLVNFISHPVLKGFTCAAALVIGMSQVQHLIGVRIERGGAPYESVIAIFTKLPQTNITTLIFTVGALLSLWIVSRYLLALLKRLKAADFWVETLPRFVPLIVVAISAALVAIYQFQTTHSLAVIGQIPRGLPGITIPEISLEKIRSLVPLSLLIAFIGFLESYSVAKALGSRKREKVDPNRELFALGAADIGAAFTGGFPVTGGFSRSVVSQEAGVRAPVASVITALIVAFSVI